MEASDYPLVPGRLPGSRQPSFPSTLTFTSSCCKQLKQSGQHPCISSFFFLHLLPVLTSCRIFLVCLAKLVCRAGVLFFPTAVSFQSRHGCFSVESSVIPVGPARSMLSTAGWAKEGSTTNVSSLLLPLDATFDFPGTHHKC